MARIKNREDSVNEGYKIVAEYARRYRQNGELPFTATAECVLGELLCDLRHYADELKLDWNTVLAFAYRHFEFEGGRADTSAPQAATAG